MRTWFRGGRSRPAVPEGAAGIGLPESGEVVEAGPWDGSYPEPAASALAVDGRSAPDVVLVTRQGCHLCEQADPVVREAVRRHGASLAVLDVDQHPALRERWTAHVPVLLVRGVLVDYWRVDERRLEAALRGQRVPSPPALD